MEVKGTWKILATVDGGTRETSHTGDAVSLGKMVTDLVILWPNGAFTIVRPIRGEKVR